VKTAWTFDWTDAAIALLTELWLGGHSGGEISRRMGVSRSGIMGKLRREGLLCRDRPRMPIVRLPRQPAQLLTIEQPVSRPQKPQMRTNKRPLPLPTPYQAPPPPPRPPYGRLKVLDLRHNSCRWPEGDGPIFIFCGRPQAPLSSYCPEHRAMAHARGSQRDFDRMAAQALGGKLFASRAGIEQ
jgi:hypothetical protein